MKKAEETVKAMITEEQLKTLQEQQGKLNEMLRTVGVLEVQKENVLQDVSSLSKEVEATKKELEKEYGQININLQDGTYEDIAEEDAKYSSIYAAGPYSVPGTVEHEAHSVIQPTVQERFETLLDSLKQPISVESLFQNQ